MAVVYAAAILSGEKTLRRAMLVITLVFLFTRLSRVLIGTSLIGYAGIDALTGVIFWIHWRTTGSLLIIPLIILQIAFLAVHIMGGVLDLSGFYFGAPRSDAWLEAFLRNRLFELGLIYILIVSLYLISISRWRTIRKIVIDITRRLRRTKLKSIFPDLPH